MCHSGSVVPRPISKLGEIGAWVSHVRDAIMTRNIRTVCILTVNINGCYISGQSVYSIYIYSTGTLFDPYHNRYVTLTYPSPMIHLQYFYTTSQSVYYTWLHEYTTGFIIPGTMYVLLLITDWAQPIVDTNEPVGENRRQDNDTPNVLFLC